MVLARKGRSAQSKQPVGEVPEMAHGWPAGGEGPGAGGGPAAEPGVPRAMFMPHANSLPFDERCVSLEHPVKIGRNVYRAVPCPTNTIFECRVLSRHHATLWYEKGHFYIMDNQSSNGTFINNNRCSISKEAEPHEVFSGDVLQFGIAVVENQTNQEKNTFLPVVALLKLYHPDGKEAKQTFNPAMTTPLHLKELYQLNNFLQEAVGREAALEARLRALRECVERTRAEALSGWELLVGEQRLLARVHALEAAVAAGKPIHHDKLERLLEDKQNYQEVAQESLRLAHEQRLALEEALERKGREAHALHQHNCDLRLTTNHALAELQKLAARCERKMCAARLAIATAEEREAATRARLPLALSKVNGEARMLVMAGDGEAPHRPDEPPSLEEAVRALPDYVKLMLPENVLGQVGIKAITIDGKLSKEFDVVQKKNELNDIENRSTKENRISLEDGVGGGAQLEDNCRELDTTAVSSSDDERNGRLNHDSSELSATVLECDMNSTHLSPDNNANSFLSLENHDNSGDKGQPEYGGWLAVMGGLREEVAALRARLADLSADNDKLREVRDQLLSVKLEVQEELNERSMLEQAAEDADEAEKHDPESHKEQLAELSARLERAAAAERALAAELALRPTARDVELLAETCHELRARLRERDAALDDIQRSIDRADTCERSVSTSEDETVVDELSALNELDAALDELGGDESDGTDEEKEVGEDMEGRAALDDDAMVGEEVNGHAALLEEVIREDLQKHQAHLEKMINGEDATEYEALEDEVIKQAAPTGEEAKVEQPARGEDAAQMGDGAAWSREPEGALRPEEAALLALQEELVRAKERWAEAAAQCARLQAAREAPGAPRAHAQTLAVAAALLAAALYALLYRYVS